MWYFTIDLNKQNIYDIYLTQESCLRYVKSPVNKCDVFGYKYNARDEIIGAMVLAPNMDGKYNIIYDIGPEYLDVCGIKEMTEEEISEIINREGEERGY